MRIVLLRIAGMLAMLGSCALAQEGASPSASAEESVSNFWIYAAAILGSGVLGYLFRLFRPALIELARKLRVDFAVVEAEKLVPAIARKFADGINRAKADGVVTKEEFDGVVADCVAEFRNQFPTIVRALGPVVIEGIIREFVDLLLPGNTAAQRAARPFSGSSQPPLAELQPVVRGSTGEAFG